MKYRESACKEGFPKNVEQTYDCASSRSFHHHIDNAQDPNQVWEEPNGKI